MVEAFSVAGAGLASTIVSFWTTPWSTSFATALSFPEPWASAVLSTGASTLASCLLAFSLEVSASCFSPTTGAIPLAVVKSVAEFECLSSFSSVLIS